MAKASSKRTVVKRPVRHMKSDRVISPTLSVEEQQCDTMVGALTHDTQRMDWKWGIGRLEELVSTETAAKYGLAMAKLNEARYPANNHGWLLYPPQAPLGRPQGVPDAQNDPLTLFGRERLYGGS